MLQLVGWYSFSIRYVCIVLPVEFHYARLCSPWNLVNMWSFLLKYIKMYDITLFILYWTFLTHFINPGIPQVACLVNWPVMFCVCMHFDPNAFMVSCLFLFSLFCCFVLLLWLENVWHSYCFRFRWTVKEENWKKNLIFTNFCSV